jgi:cell division protein FtsL
VKIKEELRQTRKQIENNEREIDYAVSEIIEFLKHKRIIETRKV